MKAIHIKTEPFQFISVKKLSVHRKNNCHSNLAIQGIINAELEMSYYDMCIRTSHLEFNMTVADEEEEQLFFCGIVTDFRIEKDGTVCTLSLQVTSGTYLMDLAEHRRFYQKESLPASDIFKELCKTYPLCNYIINREREYLLDRFTIQYHETDWQFLKRLASRYHLSMIPADYLPGIHFYVGITSERSHEVTEDDYTIICDTQEHYEKSSQMDCRAISAVSYLLKSREVYYLGEEIIFNRCKMYIYEIESKYLHGELSHCYKLRVESGFKVAYQSNTTLIGASFDAEIAEIVKDKVLINILNGENIEEGPVKLFPFSTVYSSPDGTGWYCMPESGDTVRLYIPSANEADGYVISAIHQKSSEASSRVNPSVKSLKTRYGKEIYFTPKSIVLTNHKGNTITMHDDEGILIESNKDIVMKAKGDVSLTSTEQTLLINASDKIDICQGGSQLTIDDDIAFKGGKLRME